MEQILNENNKRLSRLVFKFNILLLADVFEKFRYNRLKNDGLFPSRERTNLKAKLELIPDPDMYIIFLIDTVKPTRGV